MALLEGDDDEWRRYIKNRTRQVRPAIETDRPAAHERHVKIRNNFIKGSEEKFYKWFDGYNEGNTFSRINFIYLLLFSIPPILVCYFLLS